MRLIYSRTTDTLRRGQNHDKKLFLTWEKYRTYAILAPIMIICEVTLEVIIPRIMASIVDIGVAGKDTGYIIKMGALMIFMALASLLFGALAARFASVAATGFAKNIRKSLFIKFRIFI